MHSNSHRKPLLGLTVIHKYPEERAKFSRQCHTGKNCYYSWTELNPDNGKISSRSHPYHPNPSGPGWVFFCAGYQKIFLFFSIFAQPPSPLFTPPLGSPLPHLLDGHRKLVGSTWHRNSTIFGSLPAPRLSFFRFFLSWVSKTQSLE